MLWEDISYRRTFLIGGHAHLVDMSYWCTCHGGEPV